MDAGQRGRDVLSSCPPVTSECLSVRRLDAAGTREGGKQVWSCRRALLGYPGSSDMLLRGTQDLGKLPPQ
jgi:hypothetical protein